MLAIPGNALEPVIIDESLKIKNIGHSIEYLLDETKSLAINDFITQQEEKKFKWKKSNAEDLRLGYEKAAIWVRISARNTSNGEIEWLLRQNHFSITRLSLYILDNNKIIHHVETGNMFRFDQRPFDDPTFVFPVKIRANASNEYYLRFVNKYPTSILLQAASLRAFYAERDKLLPFLWILYGFFIVMIGYNIVLFLSINEKSYLYYTLFISTFLAYMMHYNGHAGQYLWGNYPLWANNMGYIFISLIVATVMQFIRHFISLWDINRGIDFIFKVLIVMNLAIGILSLFLNEYMWYGILLISTAILSLIFGFITIIYSAAYKNSRQAKIYLLSSIILFIGAMVFALRALDLIPGTFLTSHGIIIGGAFQVIVLSTGLADKINIMKKDILKAEVKYRHIVESSAEIIFSLDKHLNILGINNAVKKHLGYSVDEVISKNFLDFIQDTWSERTLITRQLVEEQISDLFKRKSSVQFRTTFKTRYGSEPVDFIVKFEYIEADEAGYNILGKAFPVTDDTLLKFLVVEHFIYTIDNYLNSADLMSQRLTRNLTRYFPQSEVPLIRVAIREVLVNAIEHGNLGLSFEEKTVALEKDFYFDLIHKRQRDPGFCEKKVTVDYQLDEKKVIYRISDEGEGFNYEEIMSIDPTEENTKMLCNGRGLVMARTIFDIIQFNEKGNEIKLVKYFG